jgi:hypothetical protein
MIGTGNMKTYNAILLKKLMVIYKNNGKIRILKLQYHDTELFPFLITRVRTFAEVFIF